MMGTGKRIGNLVFSALVVLLLSSALVCALADIAIPGFDMPKKSRLEGSTLVSASNLAKKSFMDGEFQDSAELYLSGKVPKREQMLLLSAGLQREGIHTANLAFGYPFYPTYFGSTHLESADKSRIFPLAADEPESPQDHAAFARALNAAAQKHPSTRFVVDIVAGPSQTKGNPSYSLVTSHPLLNEDWISRAMIEPLDSSIDAYVDPVHESELAEPCFANDVHWNLQRALESYNRLAGKLGLKVYEWDEDLTVSAIDRWYGTQARLGRDLEVASQLVDLQYDFSMLQYRALNGSDGISRAQQGAREAFLDGTYQMNGSKVTYDAYTSYYGYGNADILNHGPNNGKTCLVIGDSFSYCLKRYIASNYERTIYLLPGNLTMKKSLEKWFSTNEIDDVIVLMQSQKPKQIASLSPNFIKVGSENS